MNTLYLVSGILSAAVLLYLFVALLKPEKFE
jgi:K+-transporting ATPase KdpF subunit